jgi:hypothetical protein
MMEKLLRGTLFGGIAYFFLGWLVWGILLGDFYSANYNQCANRPEMEMVWWAMIVSNLVYALLLTIILNWAGTKKAIDGLKTAAIFGFLLGLTLDLSFYSMTTMFNCFTGIIVDVLVTTVVTTVIGLVIVSTWGKPKAE